MNSLEWKGDESIEDIPEPMRTLAIEKREADLTKEIYLAINGHGSGFEEQGGELRYTGPQFDPQELTIIALSYRRDANKMIKLAESED